MSKILDPSGGDGPNEGDGPNKGDETGAGNRVAAGSAGERQQDEGRGAQGDRKEGGDQTKTASKGINPVQHSE